MSATDDQPAPEPAPVDEQAATGTNQTAVGERSKRKQREGVREAVAKRQNRGRRGDNEPREGGESTEDRRPKRKVGCLIGYCGTGYHGMQVNPPNKTIEGDLFEAFVNAKAISQDNATDPKKSSFMRAARTDKGVHAAGNVVSLKLIIEDADIVDKINALLPPTIRLWGFTRTTKGFECRKHCDSRIYEYLIPSYAFLPPKPTSELAQRLKSEAAKYPGVTRDDPEGAEFWAGFYRSLAEAGLDESDVRALVDEVAPPAKKDADGIAAEPLTTAVPASMSEEHYRRVKQIRAIENAARRAYRIAPARLELVREVLKKFEGAHKFHNYTVGKPYSDPSARRFMKSLAASEPKLIDGTEWISIKIHGQSFMLHQIRKMIAMTALVIRCGAPLSRIDQTLTNIAVNIPKAPSLGLLLERPVYDNFNDRLKTFGYDGIDFDQYAPQIEAFKMKHIYDKIYHEEAKENVFHGFFGFLDNFRGNVHIFDYLTAKGVSEKTEAVALDAKLDNDDDESDLVGDTEG
ncbi:pseudouridine synthase [Dipodascopsis tothii]|uniref:pseudouridine synthase n=1 Tax=Dipodascopsis tothii TaxID=44089 RepID=UPI0034CEDA07